MSATFPLLPERALSPPLPASPSAPAPPSPYNPPRSQGPGSLDLPPSARLRLPVVAARPSPSGNRWYSGNSRRSPLPSSVPHPVKPTRGGTKAARPSKPAPRPAVGSPAAGNLLSVIARALVARGIDPPAGPPPHRFMKQVFSISKAYHFALILPCDSPSLVVTVRAELPSSHATEFTRSRSSKSGKHTQQSYIFHVCIFAAPLMADWQLAERIVTHHYCIFNEFSNNMVRKYMELPSFACLTT